MSSKQTQHAYQYLENDAEVLHRLIQEGAIQRMGRLNEKEPLDPWLDKHKQTRKMLWCFDPTDRPHREMPDLGLFLWKELPYGGPVPWLYRYIKDGEPIPKDATHGWWGSYEDENNAVTTAVEMGIVTASGAPTAWTISSRFPGELHPKVPPGEGMLVLKKGK